MGAGKYRHLLTFQKKTVTLDHGAEVPTWTDEFQEYGAYEPAFGQAGSHEFLSAMKMHAETTARFVIRWREGIDPALHRIVHDGKYWDIQAPYPPDGRYIELVIEAKESR